MTLKISKNNAFNSIQFGGFRQICDQKNPQNEESQVLSAIPKCKYLRKVFLKTVSVEFYKKKLLNVFTN